MASHKEKVFVIHATDKDKISTILKKKNSFHNTNNSIEM